MCANLVKIAYQKGCMVFRGDALHLPIRSESVDAVISVAVLHHFSTVDRRRRALREIERVLKIGGLACITVWAMEQSEDDESAYARTRKPK